MTTITTSPASTRTVPLAGVGVGLVAATLSTLFAHDSQEALVEIALVAIGTVGVFGYVVPRALRKQSAGGTALTLGILAALLVVPAFWSGLPFVFGVAAVLVGNAGRSARTGSGRCIAGLVLGALAALFYLSIYVSEGIAGNAGFVFA
jgi:hypothetical protein